MKPTTEGRRIPSAPLPPLTIQVISGCPLPPEQIWMSLAPTQQQAVFQVLIRVCQQLVRSSNTGVRHEGD